MNPRLLIAVLPWLVVPALSAQAQPVGDRRATSTEEASAESPSDPVARAVRRLQEKLTEHNLSDDEIEMILSAASSLERSLDRRPSEVDQAVLQTLNGEQLSRVLIAQEEARKARYETDGEPPAVAIVVPVASFLFIIGLVWVYYFMRNRAQAERQQTLRMMVEKGTEIPPGLVASEQKHGSDLRRGVILVATSIGVAAFLFMVDDSDQAWSLSLIPFMLGIGYLIAHRLEEGAKDLP